jgi:NodT family efflux transporter outer membrane factor (OMF) lipoprotein
MIHERRFWRHAAQISVVALTALLAFGCITKVGPDYTPPRSELPDAWHEAATEGLAEGEAVVQTWWTVFEDPVLDDLLQRAQKANLDLTAGLYRVQEARALRGIATGERVPLIDGFGSYDRSQASENSISGGDGEAINIWNLGAGATWEIDVWGRIRRAIESATAGFEASVEDYRDVLVGVLAEVALSYIDIRALQARIDYAEANVATQMQTLQLTQDRFDAGLVSALDIAQAESNLANTRSVIPSLERSLGFAYNRLAVLLGQTPGSLQQELGGRRGEIPVPPEAATVGLPADLLRQRPDVRRAERELAAQTALIGVAKADLYPAFGLAGTLQLEALNFSDLGDSSSITWSLGAGFRWNIFAGGRIRNRIRVEEARTAQALVRYEQAVLFAVEEVENALIAYQKERERRDRLVEAVDANQRSLDLVMTQYRAGLTNFQNVLDTERSLFNRQDTLAESEGLVVQSLVALYRALGGGWDPDAVDPALALKPGSQAAELAQAESATGGTGP